jgi:hypothetical protein
MSTATPTKTETPTYGGFHKPKPFGLWNLGPIGTGLAIATAFVTILLVPITNIVYALVFAGFMTLLLGALGIKDKHHQSLLNRVSTRIGYRRAVKRGATEYISGTLTHMGGHQLPGVLSGSTLHRWEDKTGNPFTVLRYRNDKSFVVNIAAEPDGSSLVDPDDLTLQVEKYGEWLASLAYEPDLRQAAITIECSTDTGSALVREMDNHKSPSASVLSMAWADDLKKTYPKGGSTIRAYVSATYGAPAPDVNPDGSKVKGQDPLDVIGRVLADRIPSLLDELPETGAGDVEVMSIDDVIEVVKCAYNPHMREVYDDLASRGEQPPVTVWDSVGPEGSKAHWTHYEHSGAASITWEASGFVSTRVISKALEPLLQPSPDVAVKRVTFLYKPVKPEHSGAIAEKDHSAAQARIIDAKKPTARHQRTLEEAETARSNEANGNALINFAILVTATVLDVSKLPAATAAINRLGPTARLHLRRMNGSQDSAFAQAVGPLGLRTSEHLAIPTALSEGI